MRAIDDKFPRAGNNQRSALPQSTASNMYSPSDDTWKDEARKMKKQCAPNRASPLLL